MKTVYIDTNIFDYVILRNETYGEACKVILEDISNNIEAVCSFQVPIELLGSISEIDPVLAYEGLQGFFSFKIRIVEISQRLLLSAASISNQTGISGYDAVHVAAMKQEGLDTIITENYKDFKKIKDLEVIRPLDYGKRFGAFKKLKPFTKGEELDEH
jgi:predicted nucleic acid-binding protein